MRRATRRCGENMIKILVLLLASVVFLPSCQSIEAPSVSVTGSAVVETSPDMLSFTLAAEYTGSTTEEAMSVASGMISYAVSILRNSFGVEEEDICTEYFSISPSYSYQDGERVLEGQSAVERLRVILHDIDRAGDMIAELSALDGIEIYNLQAGKSDKSMETMKARELAVHDAYAKATVYAHAAGYELGPLVSLSDSEANGFISEEAKTYTALSTASGAEYFSGVMEISDSVNAVFSLVE